MRVAVCLSGQSRTALVAVPSLLSYFPNADFFCHVWNYNSWKKRDGRGYIDEDVSESHLDHVFDLIEPKAHLIGHKNNVRFSELHWAWHSLFYSMMEANRLKREHEIANGFEYDIVVKARYDVAFPPNTTFAPMKCADRTIWFEFYDRMKYEYRRVNLSDVYFYGDSWGMDVASDFYRYLRDNNDPHTMKCGPGVLLHEHLTKHHVRFNHMPWHRSGGFRSIIVRKEMDGLDIVKDWKRISDSHMEFYL